MAPLDRALALEEVHGVAMRIGEHLDFDVPRPLDQPLDIERAVAESALCLAARGGNGFRNGAGLARDAHAFAATAGRRLDEDRISDPRRCCVDARVRLV